LVTAPGRNGKPICLSCYSLVDGEYYCAECGWQVCNEVCEQAPPHRAECAIYKEKGIDAQWEDVDEDTFVMDFIGAFRLLLAVQADPDKKKLLDKNMQTERRQKMYNSRYYTNCEEVLMKYIRDTCGVTGFTDNQILNALGIMEIYGSVIQNGAKVLHGSYMGLQHSCCPNTYSTLNPDLSLTVRASVHIRSGEAVTRSLVEPLLATQFRRRDLERVFLVDCTCKRCGDPTEMGTNLGGLVSLEHDGAVFLPTKPLEDEGGPWTSPTAPGVNLPGAECTSKLEIITRKCDSGLAEMGGSTMGLEFVLNTKGEWDILPSYGQVMLGVKSRLISGWQNSGLEPEKLKTKFQYCEELIDVLSKVCPGRNYKAAMLHYEAAAVALALAQQGDKSLCTEGASHANLAREMVEGEEEGSMYQQLGEYVKGLANQLRA